MKYRLFQLVAALVRLTPRRVAYAVARVIAVILHRLKTGETAKVAANLQRIAAYRGQPISEDAAHSRVREVYFSFAKTIVDYYYFAAAKGPRAERLASLTEIVNMESFARASALGKGTVVVTAHLGIVENGGAAIVRHGYAFNVVALPQADARMDELFQRQRIARGMSVIPMGRATRDCLRAIRRNEMVALLGDRDFSTNRDLTTLFGAPARVPLGPARLALSVGAPIVVGFCVRLPGDRYRLFMYDPIFVDTSKDTIESLTRRVTEYMERAIGESPEQWHVFHNPWDIDEDWTIAQNYVRNG